MAEHHRNNLLFLLATLALSISAGLLLNPQPPFTKKDLLRALEQRAAVMDNAPALRIILGSNANLDVVVHDSASLIQSVVPSPLRIRDHATITSVDDLAEAFAFHLSTSSAGERFVASEDAWRKILAAVDATSAKQTNLGGNAALMANALDQLSPQHQVTLAGPIGPEIQHMLRPKITQIAGPGSGELDPKHLIFEYKAGAQYATHVAERANRFIVSRDYANSMLSAVDELSVSARYYDLIVLAGVHLLDGMEPHVQDEQLARVASVLESTDVKTHLELGSIGSQAFLQNLVRKVLPLVESIGLNEQELVSLCDALDLRIQDPTPIGVADMVKRRVEALTTRVVKTDEERVRAAMKTSTPPVVLVQRAIELVFALTPKLERVHFHSFGYHVLALRNAALTKWGPSPEAALAKGSVAATERACGDQKVSSLHGKQLALNVQGFYRVDGVKREFVEFDELRPTAAFEGAGGVRFHVAPVVACVEVKMTVGLGDFISASALG